MQGKLRGDDGHGFIGAVIAALFMVLLPVVVFAGQAELKKDKGGDDGIPKRVIHGMPVNGYAVEMLLIESEGDAEVELRGAGKGIGRLKGKFHIDRSKPVEDAVLDFMDRHGDSFGLDEPSKEMKLVRKNELPQGSVNLRFEQMYKGVPVSGNEILVHVNKSGYLDKIIALNSSTPDIDTTPLVSEEEAIAIARQDIASGKFGEIYDPMARLNINNDGQRLIYVVTFMYNLHSWVYLIDAKSGEIIKKINNDRYGD